MCTLQRPTRKTWCMGPYAAELTITSPYVDSRVDSNTFTMGNLLSEPTIYPPVRGFGLGFLCLTEADAHFFLPLYGGGGIIPSTIFRAHALKLWRIASLGRFNAHKMLGHSPCVARRICGFSSTRRHLESRSPVNHGRYFQTFKEPRN